LRQIIFLTNIFIVINSLTWTSVLQPGQAMICRSESCFFKQYLSMQCSQKWWEHDNFVNVPGIVQPSQTLTDSVSFSRLSWIWASLICFSFTCSDFLSAMLGCRLIASRTCNRMNKYILTSYRGDPLLPLSAWLAILGICR
jgi:hypothetical protein